jgi:hypothetical protein
MSPVLGRVARCAAHSLEITMRTSRRHLIKLGLCATASLTTFFEGLSGRDASAAAPQAQAPLDDGLWLRRDLFETRVGEYFAVRKPRSGTIALRLTRVEDVLSARNAGTVGHPDCFTVILRGSTSSKLKQGTYRVESPTLGTFLLFLVPGPVMGSSIRYAATFNRITTSQNQFRTQTQG